jgi:integrative and conjugative element protein (TIGR02256 family)
MKPPRVMWLAHDVLSALTEEANRATPAETGGVLLGYIAELGKEPVVTHSVGPGPNAVHERTRFVPDHDFQLAEIARLYAASGARLQYLGDWHTLPDEAAYLSRKDKATIKQIALCKDARIKTPLMLILGFGPEWKPVAWMGTWVSSPLWRRGLVTHLVRIEVFGDRTPP